jgi:prephenate dehydrogenase
MVILATPVCTYTDILTQISEALPQGCIVTDVGSTKHQVHQWAKGYLPKTVTFVGSHPLAGSEQQGIEFARDDLLIGARCIVTHQGRTDPRAVACVCEFWRCLGCFVSKMSPKQHDRITATISHVPHAVATALVNATPEADLDYAGKGFIDTSRIASGPPNIWSDILLTNHDKVCHGIDKVILELTRLKETVRGQRRVSLERLLHRANTKRASMIKHKIRRKELL